MPEEPFIDPKGLKRVLAAAGELVSPRVQKMAVEHHQYYLWKQKDGQHRIGVCSKCKARFPVDGMGLRHGDTIVCPYCGRVLIVKDTGRGHAKLYEDFYIAEWRKSETEPDTVVLVDTYCWYDQTGVRPEEAVPHMAPTGICVFRYGKDAVCFKRHWYWSHKAGETVLTEWEHRRECTPINTMYASKTIALLKPDRWFGEAVEGTRYGDVLRRLGLDSSKLRHDGVREMELITKRPYLEYLAKMGQTPLAMDILHGARVRGIINGRGKTAQAVLGLTGQQLAEVKQQRVTLTTETLRFAGILRRLGINWRMKDIASGAKVFLRHVYNGDDDGEASIRLMLPELREKAVKYILRLSEHPPEGVSRYNVHRDITDYWKQLIELKADLRDEQIVFPKDLLHAHEQASLRVKLVANEHLNEKIAGRAQALSTLYAFQHGELMLRPCASAEEIIREGNTLRHCVGGYAESYSEGGTILCVLRRVDKPDEPWRTVEFSAKSGDLVQCRGFKNKSPEDEQPEIKDFFAAWRKYRNKAKLKASKKKEKKTA